MLANALAWIAGLAVVFAAIAVAPPDAPVLTAVFGVAGGLGMGFTVALVTGGVTGNVCPVAGIWPDGTMPLCKARSGGLVGVAGLPIPSAGAATLNRLASRLQVLVEKGHDPPAGVLGRRLVMRVPETRFSTTSRRVRSAGGWSFRNPWLASDTP